MSRPEISLLVSTFQRPWHLTRVLESIAAQRGVAGRMELVISDDGSEDETPEIVERFASAVDFPVKFTTHPHTTFRLSRCRNEGVAASSAPYLLFIDGDCILPPDHVAQHLTHRKPNVVMAGDCARLEEEASRQVTPELIRAGQFAHLAPPEELKRLAKAARKARLYNLLRHPTKPKLIGNNVGIWRKDYESVNGYDENFQGWGGEDDDLRLRLRNRGVRIESILRWTHTYHLWHPVDVTAPASVTEGANNGYLNRTARLTRCRNGLVKRDTRDLALRVVGECHAPALAKQVLAPLGGDMRTPDAKSEVELLFLPGKGNFSGRAEYNVLVVLDETPLEPRLARKAHIVVAKRPCPGVDGRVYFPLTELDQALAAVA